MKPAGQKRSARKRLLLLLVPVLLLAGSVVAYTVLTLSASVNVNEPLSVSNASITDSSSNSAGTCTVSGDAISCSLSVYAGESGALTFTLGNAASVPVVPAILASSSDPTDVPVSVSGVPNHGGVPASGSITVTVSFTASQSTPPESVTLSVSVSR